MHTDYQAVARQLEWLADDLPDSETKLDLKTLARNVRLLGVMTHVLTEVRRRRRLANLAIAPVPVASPTVLATARVSSDRPAL